jgi:hypothetical protein
MLGAVRLENQFDSQEKIVDVSRVEQFCNAVSKDGSVIRDSAAHLTCYKVRQPKPFIKAQVIATPDQFDPLELDVRKRRTTQLCVPSQFVQRLDPPPTATPTASPTATPTTTPTSPTSPTATPTATPIPIPIPILDHFELYRTKRTKGAPKFVPELVELDDRFLNGTTTMELKKPVQIGVPTDKNDEGITNSLTHLTCYSVRAPRVRIQEVIVTNQFRTNQRLSVRKPSMLCVPSFKQLVTLR